MLALSAMDVFACSIMECSVDTAKRRNTCIFVSPFVRFCLGMATKADGMSLVQLYRRMVMR